MEQKLIELAKRHIDKISNRDAALEKEQEELEQRLNEIKAERSQFVEKKRCLETYEPTIKVCPVCWINDGTTVEFKPMSDDAEFDKFKCSHCGSYVEIES